MNECNSNIVDLAAWRERKRRAAWPDNLEAYSWLMGVLSHPAVNGHQDMTAFVIRLLGENTEDDPVNVRNMIPTCSCYKPHQPNYPKVLRTTQYTNGFQKNV